MSDFNLFIGSFVLCTIIFCLIKLVKILIKLVMILIFSSVKDYRTIVKRTNYLGKDLNALRKEGKLCDFTLCTEDDELFPVHKVVLMTASKMFNALFSYQQEDIMNVKDKSFLIENVSKENLEKIIEYMYTGNIEITSDNVKSIFEVSSFLTLENLIDFCMDHMCALITTKNCIELWNLTKVYGSLCEKLEDHCIVFTMKNAETILKSKQFIEEISIEQLKVLIASHKERCKEELLFSAVMNWINYGYNSRKSFLTELLKKIKTELISTEFLSTAMQKDGLLFNDKIFLQNILKIINYNLKSQSNTESNKKQSSNNNECFLNENFITIMNKKVIRYSNKNKEFSNKITNLPFKTDYWCSTVSTGENKKLFIFDKNYRCHLYLKHRNKWNSFNLDSFSRNIISRFPSSSVKLNPFHCSRTTILNDKIYMSVDWLNILQLTEIDFLNEVAKDIFIRNTNSLHFSEKPYGICSLNNCIYIFDGLFNNYSYDLRSNNVNCLNSTIDDNIIQIIAHDNYIYGFSNRFIYTFDIRNNKWVNRRLYASRYMEVKPHSCIYDNKIIVFGQSIDFFPGKINYNLQAYNPNNLEFKGIFPINSKNVVQEVFFF